MRRKRLFPAAAVVALLGWATSGGAAIYTVSPGGSLKAIVNTLQAGDIVNVLPGTYNEVMKIQCDGTALAPITIRGVGDARPIFDATGLNVNGVGANPRAVFQIEGDNIILDNLEMRNARNGDNGAGVRMTESWVAHNTVIRNCKISYCDMGMMGGAADYTLIENCDVGYNGTSLYNGYSHNFYMGGPGTITVRGCYIHDALYGQNFKSRAHYNELLYNWISDSNEGEVGPVDGGSNTSSANSNTLMVGNVVVSKPDRTGNHMKYINFGHDSGGRHNGTMYVYNNTLISGDPQNIHFLWVTDNYAQTHIVAANNCFYGSSVIVESSSPADSISGSDNWMPTGASTSPGVFTNTVYGTDPGFINAGTRTYLLAPGSACVDAGASPLTYVDGSGVTRTLTLDWAYLLGVGLIPRRMSGQYDIGAYEYVLPGDADFDGDVDFSDYQALELRFGLVSGATWLDGDFDGDGAVTFADYQALEGNFGSAIPEPSALLLLAGGGLVLARRRG